MVGRKTRKTRKTRKNLKKNKTKHKSKTKTNKNRTKKIIGGKPLGWEKKVKISSKNRSDTGTKYLYGCKYFYNNENDKRTYRTHTIHTDDPKFKCDDAYLQQKLNAETDEKKIKGLTEIQDSKKNFEESIQKEIEEKVKEREEEAARKAGEEADLNTLVEGKKAEAAEKARIEAEEKARIEVEEKARIEAEEKAKQIITTETNKNLKKARDNVIKQLEETKQKREQREREAAAAAAAAAEKQNKIDNGYFGEYKTTDGKTKYFLINPYDTDANCDPAKNINNEDFTDPITANDLNGCNIIQLGNKCWDIEYILKWFNNDNVIQNRNYPSKLGLNKDNYNYVLISILTKWDYTNRPFTQRDFKYLRNFITKLLEKGEDPFAPPQ